MIKALFWKEWCEQRWKLAYGCVLLIGFVAVGLRSRLVQDDIIIIMAAGGSSVLMALLVGMGLVATERGEGSIEMLLALPVRSWKIFAVKMAMGALVCALPIVGCMVVSLAMAGGREMSTTRIVVAYLGCVAFSIVMLVWMVAFSIRQPSEARAGLVGIGVFMGWVSAILLSMLFFKPPNWFGLVITPLGILVLTFNWMYNVLEWLVAVQLALFVCLLLWGAYRFGKEGMVKV